MIPVFANNRCLCCVKCCGLTISHCVLVHFLKISFKGQLNCKVDITESTLFFTLFLILLMCIYLRILWCLTIRLYHVFCYPYFHVSNSALCLTSVLLFSIYVALKLSIHIPTRVCWIWILDFSNQIPDMQPYVLPSLRPTAAHTHTHTHTHRLDSAVDFGASSPKKT